MAKPNRSTKPSTLDEQRSDGLNHICEAQHLFQAILGIVEDMNVDPDHAHDPVTVLTLIALAEKGMRETGTALTILDGIPLTGKTKARPNLSAPH